MLRWALATGRTPRELLASVSSRDITEMMAFESLEPFGALPADWRAGQIAAVVANVHRDPEKPALTPADFMPALRAAIEATPSAEKPKTMTAEDASALLDAVLFGGAPRQKIYGPGG